MRVAEKILAIAVVAGVILMFSLITGGQELTMIALLSLASIYYPLGFLLFNQIRLRDALKKTSYAHVTVGKGVVAFFAGLALSIICVGTLFKLLTLPGAGEMLVMGVAGVIVMLIVVGVMKLRGNDINSKFIFIRLAIIGGLGLTLILTSQLSLVKLQYRDHPAYIDAYALYVENPENESLWKEKELEYNRVWMSEEEFKEYKQSQNN